MSNMKIYQVDAFTDRPFSGNPAGVCILHSPADSDWMQKVAREMNLSETAFLFRENGGYNLRWFTPTVEVDLCGHATLASAHVLWQEKYLREDQEAKFYTNSGNLSAKMNGNWIDLNFSVESDTETLPPEGLFKALGVKALYVGKNRFDYIVEVESEKILRNIEPDFILLGKVLGRVIIVTSLSDTNEFDFVSRCFAPRVGVNEDPVTGSAHCCLGPYWMNRLGKSEFNAYQASARGGILKIRIEGNRIIIGGQAVTIFNGNLIA